MLLQVNLQEIYLFAGHILDWETAAEKSEDRLAPVAYQVAEEFTVRAFAQAGGSASNLKAYKAMNSAILAAKRQIQNAASHGTQNPVKMAGEHSATVKSAKDSSTEYDISCQRMLQTTSPAHARPGASS